MSSHIIKCNIQREYMKADEIQYNYVVSGSIRKHPRLMCH